MTDLSAWAVAHKANREKVIAHKDFPKLVREVAIAEQPSGTPRRLRNSITYALWYTRDNRGSHHTRLSRFTDRSRRARKLSLEMTKDLGILDGLPDSERWATAYNVARDYVRARERGITVR